MRRLTIYGLVIFTFSFLWVGITNSQNLRTGTTPDDPSDWRYQKPYQAPKKILYNPPPTYTMKNPYKGLITAKAWTASTH